MINLNSLLGITDEDIISLKEENILNPQATKKLNLSIGMDNPTNFPLGFSNVNYTNSTFTVNSSNNESIWKMESPRSLANSPLTPMSPSYAKMFLPSPTTGNNLVTNTLENLQIPSMAFNYNATYISRILTATCKDLKKLIYLIQLYIDPLNIIGARQVSIGKTQFLVIGWFDLRNISSNVSTLKLIANNEGLNDLEFDYIKNDLTFNHVTNTHNFRFLEDVYDTIYIAVDNKLPNLNINQFQNDLYFQLIKNGAVNSMKQIDSIVGCFKVRFYDIRVTFELQKMSYIKVGSLRANIYSTLVDLFESILKKNCLEQSLSNDLKLNPQQSGLPALNESEWKKYMQLKHRRLASLPFSMCSVPQENKIDISKIKSNEEKRATLMIRNIPNKVTHNELKEYIDVTSWGDYEFLYLRIDFENHCNVGYAFISFAHPTKIIPLYKAIHGKKWSKFSSEKVCQLAYAKVQGMDSLIQKFKRSKVMESNPDYRPRVYYTKGELTGQEMNFPFD